MNNLKRNAGDTPPYHKPFVIPKLEPRSTNAKTKTASIATITKPISTKTTSTITKTTSIITKATTILTKATSNSTSIKTKPTATISTPTTSITPAPSTSTNILQPTIIPNIDPSVSKASTATDNQPNQTITLSPSSYAEMTSPTFTVNDLLPRDNVTATQNPISGTTKQEPLATNNQPRTNIKQHNKQLKQEGRIKISLHGTEVYNGPEMQVILHSLRARKAWRAGPNLIQAEVLTGTYTHASQIGNQINLDNNQIHEDMGPLIDQTTQVSGSVIDEELRAKATEHWQPLTNIPEQIENHAIIPSIKPYGVNFNQRAFINYTKYPVPEEVAIILSMGPKFAAPVYHTERDFEYLRDAAHTINEIFGHPEDKAAIRANIVEYIKEYQSTERTKLATENKDYFQNAIKSTKAFMKQHPDVIAAQADKAKSSILMDKQTYINKVENLLKDQSTYQPLHTSSTRSYMKMNEKLLERMVKLKLIPIEEAKRAIGNEDKPANLYGLVKNHKKDQPMRPIVNTRNTMGFLAAEKATAILTTTRDAGLRYNVLNSRQACEQIRQTEILPNEKLYSLDIISMFTNITTERAINAVLKRRKQLRVTDEQMQLIVDIIQFVCVKSTEIRFNNRIYKQIKGLRMGSSLSPILADFVVEDMLDTAFTTIERPTLIMKYVDDILCIMEEKDAHETLTALNQCDPHIKFEMETEQNGKINYLDVTIYRDGYTLKTIWFQKHISSGLFLNYNSNHSKSNIWNTAVQYVVTMFMNTHTDHHETMTTTAMDRLTRNSYPEEYAKRVITAAKEKIVLNQMSTHVTTSQDMAERVIYTPSISYIPILTEKIQKDIQTSANKLRSEGITVQTPAKPIYTMNKLVYNKFKDSNEPFNIDDHDPDISIDLTQQNQQPSTSKQK